MKVLFIDPWGINETSEYTNGLCAALSDIVDLKVVSNYYFKRKINADYEVVRSFFRFSQNMKAGKIRRILRGYEYIRSWQKIISDIKRNEYDCIHINWLLLYKIDIHFLEEMRRTGIRIIYTAHNVLPHVKGERYVSDLRKIYALTDKIVLHGKNIRKEFETIFPEFAEKIYLQKHGCNIDKDIFYNINKIDRRIIQTIEQYPLVFLCAGNVFYNKGTDRLLRIWLQNEDLKDSLLIIAGKETESDENFTKVYAELKKQASNRDNILILDWFVPNNTMNYFFSSANVVVLPYRHASMSGVIFTAVDFSRTVVATRTGAMPEYLENIKGAFLVENNETEIERCLLRIARELDGNRLKDMGQECSETLQQQFSWKTIARKLYEECCNA